MPSTIPVAGDRANGDRHQQLLIFPVFTFQQPKERELRKKITAFAALLLIAAVARAGDITTTLVPNTPAGAPADVRVFDIMIENTDNWVNSELIYTAAGAGVHQEKLFGIVHVNGIAPLAWGSNYKGGWDTFFTYPGAVQSSAEVLPSFMPAPLDDPTSTGDLSVGWFEPGNDLIGTHKIGQLALDNVPPGEWTFAAVPNGQVIGEINLISRVREGESIYREQQTLWVTAVPEPSSMLLLCLGAFALLGMRRRG